jgi:copper chaperone CopZ
VSAPVAGVRAAGAQELLLGVEGMTCASCATRVARVLGRQPGVAAAQVNLATRQAVVALADEPARVEDLQAAIDRAGYRLLGRVFKAVGLGSAAGHGVIAVACRRMRMSEVSGR